MYSNILSQNTDDRVPTYVAGLTGDPEAWRTWRELFTAERKMAEGSNKDYKSFIQTGIHNFSLQIPLPTTANNNSIIFGASTGGIAARHIDVYPLSISHPIAPFPVRFGGIITAGSQLDGAKIANATLDGTATNFSVDGVAKVLTGPNRQFGALAGLSYEVAGYKFKFLAELGVQIYLLLEQGGTTTQEIAEGSTYMNNGNRAVSTPTPKVHIYGNENSPVFWRTTSSFAGHSDSHFVNVSQQAYDVCMASKYYRLSQALLNPFTAPYQLWLADGWGISANWLKDGSENGWNNLIGTNVLASKTESYITVNQTMFQQCLASYSGQPITYDQYRACQTNATYTAFYTYYSSVNGLSDGFIKAPSQVGYNSAWSGNATKIEALGVNHREMRTHVVMKDIYNRIFDLQITGVNNFFFTPRR